LILSNFYVEHEDLKLELPWNLAKSDRHVVDPNDQGYKIQAFASIIASLASTLATALTTSTLIMKG
jgi:hypothetical protein